MCDISSSAEAEKAKVLMVPVPVPVFIPVPMNMYSQHTPVPMAMPVPIAVPMVIPPQAKDVRDAAVQWDPLTFEDEMQKEATDHTGNEKGLKVAEAPPSHPQSSEQSTESHNEQPETPAEPIATTSEPPPPPPSPPPPTAANLEPPSSPMMDLETDFPPAEALAERTPTPQRVRGVKRPREGSSSRKRSRRRTSPVVRGAAATPPAAAATAAKLNHVYGVKAWRNWVQQRNKQPTQFCSVDIKEDILQCDSAELSFALSRFITEVRRPNGESYSPDSIFYLCLGLQQYLFTKGRIENIFTDELYTQFANEISGMLRHWRPKPLPGSGVVSSRVEESYLWECKQLGAYSPIVLLNTLLFFCTANFRLTTPAQHQRLSFASLTRHWKPCSRTGKVHYLRYQRGCGTMPTRAETERVRRRQEQEDGDLEMLENVVNPLHCPVRLYDFYLSRCPESVKERADLFYLQPERNVGTNSCHWFTTQPLEQGLLQNMLTRILAVREIQQETQPPPDAPQ